MLKKEHVLNLSTTVVCIICLNVQANIIFVDDDAAGANDGTSWIDAYTYLQDVLMVSNPGDEIRIAGGIYKPDDFVLSDRPGLGRHETFRLKNCVTVKGGYKGLQDPDARDVERYETIFSGDLNLDDVNISLYTSNTVSGALNEMFYWTDKDDSCISRTSRITGITESILSANDGLIDPRGLAIDVTNGIIYWADRNSSKIQRAGLDGTELEELYGPADGLGRPHGISLDISNNTIYWTDTVTGDIRRGDMDGQQPAEVLISALNGPWAVKVISITPDFNKDGFVGMNDFGVFSENWLKFNEGANLSEDNFIDMYDLYDFINDWLR